MGPVFVRLTHGKGLKMQKISKNCKQFAKKQIIETIKIISCYLNNMYYFNYIKSAKKILKNLINSFAPHLKMIGTCYYPNVLKDEKKKQLYHSHNFYVRFGWDQKQGIGWELSMMRISYKLTERTTKTEKFENFLKSVYYHKLYVYAL